MTPLLRSYLDMLAHRRMQRLPPEPNYGPLAAQHGLTPGYLRQIVSARMQEIREGREVLAHAIRRMTP